MVFFSILFKTKNSNMEVVKEGEQPPPKAEPISAVIEGEGVVCADGGISS